MAPYQAHAHPVNLWYTEGMADKALDTTSPYANYATRTAQDKPNIAYPGVNAGISKAQAQNIAATRINNDKHAHVTVATPTISGDA